MGEPCLDAPARATGARTNLRRTIAYLRDGVGREHEALIVAGDSLAPPSQLRSDVELVQDAGVGPADAAALAAAAATWRGEFLEGVQPDGEELDAWVGQQREVWHRRLAAICERLAGLQSDGGDSAQGLETVERWLARDPLAEPAHRLRVRLHLERDDRAAALDAYAICERLLASEVGIEPSAATRALAARARREEPSAMSSAVSRPEVPIVGRAAEHAVLVGALRRAEGGDPQLVLLAGEPGIGKTRLAVEFATWARAGNADVLHGRAFPSSANLVYQAFVDALGHRLEMGLLPLPDEPWRSELARLLPQLGRLRRNPAAGDQPLFEAAARLLRGLAAERPPLLVIDDLQWLASERLAFGPAYQDHDLVFAHPDGSPQDPDVISQTFERLIRHAGLRSIRFHDLRHTHATLALQAGVPVKVVSERLGHSKASVTQDIYQHVIPGMQEEAAAGIAAVVDGP
jgi:DNA-binding SARP family transcriptional activator